VRNIAEVTTAVARGELVQEITVEVKGRDPGAEDIPSTPMVEQLGLRVRGDPSGPRGWDEGKLGGQPWSRASPAPGRILTDNRQLMANNLTAKIPRCVNIAEVTTAVARGDLSKKDHRGGNRRDPGVEKQVNTMVDQLSRLPPQRG